MSSPLHAIGLGLLLLTLGWAGWELAWSPAPLPAPEVDTLPDVGPAPDTSRLTRPLSDYGTTLARPLFYAGRTTPSQATESAPGTPQTTSAPTPANNVPRLSLSAVIVEQGERSALLVAPGQATSTRLKVGDELAGWRLIRVDDDSVTISANGREQVLPLRDFGAAPPPPQSNTPPQRNINVAPRPPSGFRGLGRTR